MLLRTLLLIAGLATAACFSPPSNEDPTDLGSDNAQEDSAEDTSEDSSE